MIALFTSNVSGGILQFAVQLLKEFSEMGESVVCHMPRQASCSIPERFERLVKRYDKVHTLRVHAKAVQNVKAALMQDRPDVIIYLDSAILSTVVALAVGKKTRQVMTFHDAGAFHPTKDRSLYRFLHDRVVALQSSRVMRKLDRLLVLSPQSRDSLARKNPAQKDKILLLPLGAHIPDVGEQRPQETCDDRFLLFFGRIDLYKGIDTLIDAYDAYQRAGGSLHLVIAGNGPVEDDMLSKSAELGVLWLRRYIPDEEMLWLFRHAAALVLPYREATQSGIIPIAYAQGVPVITSDVPGLTQFVEDRQTGYVCRRMNDYVDAFLAMENTADAFGDRCRRYYQDYLDWQRNLAAIRSELLAPKKP